MSDSSGSVWSEIIPLFLSEGLCSTSSRGTKERKRAIKRQQKRNYLDKQLPYFLFDFGFLRSAYELNYISNGA